MQNIFLNRTIITGLILSTLLIATAKSNTQPDTQEPEFTFFVDLSQFRYSDSLTYLEFSTSLFRHLLTYIADGDNYQGRYRVLAEVMTNDSLIAAKDLTNVDTIDDPTKITETQRLFSKNYFVLQPEEYKFKITLEDLNAGKSTVQEHKVEIEDFSNDELKISDILLATSIQQDTSNNIYVKSGFRVIPNPSKIYGLGLPILYSYAEIYHLAPPTDDNGSKYLVTYKILDNENQAIKVFGSEQKIKPGASSVEVNRITAVTLFSGEYQLILEVEDLATGEKTTQQRGFFVYRKQDYEKSQPVANNQNEKVLLSAGLDEDKYDVMTEKELDKEFEHARFIASKDERKMYKKSKLEGKRNYIREFWAKRDPSPGTPKNEFKRDYLDRVELANIRYRETFREGWKTDRGRVLLVYGSPDEIERSPMGTDKKTHEIWHYYALQGGVIFVFVDKRGLGNLELVHSTMRGEIYDNSWTRFLDPTSIRR